MSERRYTDEEVAAIFEQAAVAEQALPRTPVEGEGLTLTALQEIGREVGISPESVALAAQSLDLAGRPGSARFLGLPIGVGRTVEFPHRLTDDHWEGLVADLRTTFAARGTVRYDGPFRQWTNGNLQALLEPTPNGHRLRLLTVKGNSRRMAAAGVAVLGVAATTALTLAATGGLVAGSLRELLTMGIMGGGILAAGVLTLPGWARRRRTQIDGVISRLTLAASGTSSNTSSEGGTPGRPA